MTAPFKPPKGRVVLFIEDDNDLIDMYHMVFEDAGYYFLSTSDIESAIVISKRAQRPDVILLDILLPTKDRAIAKEGFKFLEQIKKDPKLKDIPVVILTNLDTGEDMKKGIELGAEDYIVKAGHSPQVVLKRVEKVLEKYKKTK